MIGVAVEGRCEVGSIWKVCGSIEVRRWVCMIGVAVEGRCEGAGSTWKVC